MKGAVTNKSVPVTWVGKVCMIIGESEKEILGNFMGICLFVCFGGLRLGFFIRLFYTWVSLICLYFILWSFGDTISCCWESVVYNVLFLTGIYTVV